MQDNPTLPWADDSRQDDEPGIFLLPEHRGPCRSCGCEYGHLAPVNGQNVVRCVDCGVALYNAPKTELGQKPRTITTIHNGVKASTRYRVLERANGRCDLCGNTGPLHVDHLLSVKLGFDLGLTEVELNSEENLAALCEECNLGKGALPISPRLYVALLKRRQP